MRLKMRAVVVAACALVVLGAARRSNAQSQSSSWFVSPFVGGSFGGDADHGSVSTGISGGWLKGSWGVEGDLGWQPQFFKQDGFLADTQVTTITGNVLYALPFARTMTFSPYVLGGFGAIMPDLSEPGGLNAVDESKAGFNVGGGAVKFLTSVIGVRADVRYFRTVGGDDEENLFGIDTSSFDFWRAAGGIVIRF